MKVTDKYVFFWGGVFSNFYPAPIEDTGNIFACTEQAFMWHKANFFGDLIVSNLILNETVPDKAKKLGRMVNNFDTKKWDCVKFGFMVYVNYLKFNQDPELKTRLLETGDRILVEASPYDKIWGVGLDEKNPDILDESKWQGENLLGKALMEVRKILSKNE